MPKIYDSEFTLRTKVTQEAKKYIMDGGRMRHIAMQSGISQGTVSKLVYGETKHPRMHTVVSVLEALGWTLELRHHSQQNVVTLPVGKRQAK